MIIIYAVPKVTDKVTIHTVVQKTSSFPFTF